MRQQLFALPALAAGQFLFGRGHADHGQRLPIALHVTIQPLHQRQRIRPVGLDALAQFIPVLRTDDDIADAQGRQRPVQAVTQGAGLVTTVDLLGLRQLFARPRQKIIGRELLGRLRCGVVHLPDHPVAVGVNVYAELDALGFRQVLC